MKERKKERKMNGQRHSSVSGSSAWGSEGLQFKPWLGTKNGCMPTLEKMDPHIRNLELIQNLITN